MDPGFAAERLPSRKTDKKRMGNQPKRGHPNPLSTAVRT